MHSCHHAYRYIFLFRRRRDNRFFLSRLLGLFIMLLLVFLSWPEDGESVCEREREGGGVGGEEREKIGFDRERQGNS